MKRIATFAVLAAATFAPLAAADNLMYIGGGLSYLRDHDSRDVFDGDGSGMKKYGYHAAFGVSAPAMGFMGQPWLDFEWSRQENDGDRIDTVGVLYAERAHLTDSFYIGLGLGSYYNDIRIEEPTMIARTRRWRIGGKALVGLLLDRVFLEGAYQYQPGSMLGVKPSAFTLTLGFMF